MTGDFCSRESLDAVLRDGKTVLILDCRPQADYVRSHVKASINITLPGLMVRRLKKGNLKIQCVIQNNEAKDKFNKLWKTHDIILYDQSSTDNNCNTSVTVDLLMKKLQQDGASARVLDGKFFFNQNILHFTIFFLYINIIFCNVYLYMLFVDNFLH
jgi:dual specificity MAP kinase phosphatase